MRQRHFIKSNNLFIIAIFSLIFTPVLWAGDFDDNDSDGYCNLSEILHSSDPNNNGSIPATNITIEIPGDVNTIQNGINCSIGGDIVEISEGTYYENLTINRRIKLTSTDPNDPNVTENTIIDANSSSLDCVTFSYNSSNSLFEGLTVTGGNRQTSKRLYR